ncbi:transcription regulator [Trichinella spiralis]|uniref:transcription regulator n=1 Tax=Trichinella spiralis TaxID=6334 RepID=UPI0001EFE8AA|nr:transcription regulator [Trichinella spiralis]
MSTERELASSLPISSEALGSDPASEYSAISSSMDTSAGDMDSELMDSLVRDVRRLSETLTELGIALEQPTGLCAEDSATDADNNSKEVEKRNMIKSFVFQFACFHKTARLPKFLL